MKVAVPVVAVAVIAAAAVSAPATTPVFRSNYGEPNNSASSAFGPISANRTYASHAGGAGDVDWFYFATTGGQDVTVSVSNDGTGRDPRCAPLAVTVSDGSGMVIATMRIPSVDFARARFTTSRATLVFVELAPEPAASGGCRELYPYSLRVLSTGPLLRPSKRCAAASAAVKRQHGRLYSYLRQLHEARQPHDRRRIRAKYLRERHRLGHIRARARRACRPPQFALAH